MPMLSQMELSTPFSGNVIYPLSGNVIYPPYRFECQPSAKLCGGRPARRGTGVASSAVPESPESYENNVLVLARSVVSLPRGDMSGVGGEADMPRQLNRRDCPQADISSYGGSCTAWSTCGPHQSREA